MGRAARPGRFAAFLATAPGVLTAIATIITGVAGVWTAVERFWPERSPAHQRIEMMAVDYAIGPDIQKAIQNPLARVFGNVIMNRDPPDNNRPNSAEWIIRSQGAGNYNLSVEYAIQVPRPVQVHVGSALVISNALATSTGCDLPECQTWVPVGIVRLQAGENRVRFERPEGVFPHIRQLRFDPVQ